ncbi:uncharacterized protein LOC106153276 isoform X2 [Lingula anatina]|uniref:Uncharacterized protein LOC106153276 isoform X2 n=1 Tax=Lingula anatina TaxID=7574 RepID=A0A1S3H9B9_LINAN|nr:uncharacterized protein LOC106153276 isoform X2 [Lingula anatina]|eukprot:XP_013382603.1 uncharacterized protein LOC106153276 isoform X2 [Lingula anatina]
MGASCSSDKSTEISTLEKVPKFKIALVGDTEVGKSSIFLRYYKNQFDYSYRPTEKVDIDNVVRKINIPENAVMSLTLWDLPGREDMDMRKTYYKDLDAAIVVVDLTDPEQVELAPSWRQEIISNATFTREKKTKLPGGEEEISVELVPALPDDIPVLLLGNKYDLIEEQMSLEKGRKSAAQSEMKLADPRDKNEGESSADATNGNDNGEGQNEGEGQLVDDQESEARTERQSKSEDDKPETSTVNEDTLNSKNNKEDEENDEEKIGKDEQPLEDEKGDKEENIDQKMEKWEKERKSVPHITLEELEEMEKPECVKLLEKVASEHGFVGSVVVSAKDSDGSVHAAVQSFVRYLLVKRLRDKPKTEEKDNKKKNKKKKKKGDNDFEPLAEVGIKEFDDLFNKCNMPIKRSEDFSIYYEVLLHKFKVACLDAQVIQALNADKRSLEDCITGLKEAIGTGKELQMEEDDGFVKLVLTNPRMKLKAQIRDILDVFHKDFSVLCKTVLKECPRLSVALKHLDDKIATQSEQAWDIMTEAGKSKKDVRDIMNTIDKNRARIARTQMLLTECLDAVSNSSKKIEAALIW